MKVKTSTAKTIGFFSAISVLIGSVVGIGIFFKNGSVFASNDFNGIGVLLSWIIAAVIATTTAFSFGEISSSVKSKAGLAEWSAKFVGNKFGNFIKLVMPLFYFGILLPSIFVFVAEAIFNIFDISGVKGFSALTDVHMGYVFLLAIILFAFTLVTNIKYGNISRKAQIGLTASKFLPLFLTIIIGLALFSSKGINIIEFPGKPEGDISNLQPSLNPTPIDFTGILAALPAILFAFDSFLSVGSLSKEMKDGEKKIPLVIIIGMVTCSVVYLLITISQILIGQGIISNFYAYIFNGNPALSIFFEVFIDFFMFLSVIGVANGLVIASLRNFDYIVSEKLVYKHQTLKRWGKHVELAPGAYLLAIVCGFWMIVMMIPCTILDSDVLVDGMSNFPTLFFFAVYGSLVLFGLINRKSKKVKVIQIKLFIPISIIALLGIAVAFGYQIFYENFAKIFINANASISWGVLMSKGETFKVWQGAIVFFLSLAIFFLIPTINNLLIKSEIKYNVLKFNRSIKKLQSSSEAS